MSISTSVHVLDIHEDFFKCFRFKPGPVIGSGMSGCVLVATQLDSPEVKRALKIFSTRTEDCSRRSKRLFIREVMAMQSIDHPNLMKVIAAMRCPDYLAICMPYYKKGSLSSQLQDLNPSHLALYFTQLTSAIGYLYMKRIVHSDIKPSNILLDDRHNVVLGDFGVAFTVPPDKDVISSDKVGGTLAFMAPELLNLNSVDPFKLDVYSLGAVVWCMLFRVEPKSSVTFDYLHEINNSPDIPSAYRFSSLFLHDGTRREHQGSHDTIGNFINIASVKGFFLPQEPKQEKKQFPLSYRQSRSQRTATVNL